MHIQTNFEIIRYIKLVLKITIQIIAVGGQECLLKITVLKCKSPYLLKHCTFNMYTIVSNVNYWNFKRTMSHHKLSQFKSYKKEGTFQDSDIPNAR